MSDNQGSAKGEFAHGKVDPVEAGRKGGQTSGSSASTSDDTTTSSSGSTGDNYKPTEHDGLKEDGTPDKRVKGNN